MSLLLAFLATTPLCACTSSENPAPAESVVPAPSDSKVPALGTLVATVDSRDANEALRTYLDGWIVQFNQAAVGEHSGTAALVVPLDDPNTVTASEYEIELLDGASAGRTVYRATFRFWQGNPASSARPAESLTSSSTYELTRDEQLGVWAITLTSAPPNRDPQPEARQ